MEDLPNISKGMIQTKYIRMDHIRQELPLINDSSTHSSEIQEENLLIILASRMVRLETNNSIASGIHAKSTRSRLSDQAH